MSPSTSTQTRREVPSSRRRRLRPHSGSSAAATARDTAGHLTAECGAKSPAKSAKTVRETASRAVQEQRGAMFV